MFFFIQVFMRLAALELAGRLPDRSLKTLYLTDAGISLALFMGCFWPFLSAFFAIAGN